MGHRFNIRRLLNIWLRVAFYTIGFAVVYCIFNMTVDIRLLLRSFFPVLGDWYRFFTSYFLVCLLAPFINIMIEKLSSKQSKYLMIMMIFIFSIYGMINPGANPGGYSVLWIAICYIIGGCIKRSSIFSESIFRKHYFFIGYLISVISLLLIKIYSESINFDLQTTSLISYTSPFILIAAILLVICFSKLYVNNERAVRIIKMLERTNFSVFIIHANILIWNYLLVPQILNLQRWLYETTNVFMILTVVAIAIILYMLCTIIDRLRILIFRAIKSDILVDRVTKKLEKAVLTRTNI